MSLAINPETTIGALLDAYPEVESALIEMAPAFAKLRNPVVRRTVAKIATLEQAAKIGGVSLAAMIRKIRQVTGQAGPDFATVQQQVVDKDESWVTSGRVVEELNADTMLECGVHPLGRIRNAVAALGPGELVLLHSSFRPEPLIEAMRNCGVAVHCATRGTTHDIYFGRS